MGVFDGLKIPRIIYETDSKLNGHIRVVEVGSTRKILVDNIAQSISCNSPSIAKLYWGQLADSLKKKTPDIKRVLILGLGGGTLVHLISKNFPNAEIVSVEYDPVMVDISKRYFDLDQVLNHRIIQDDAMKVVIEPEEYDIAPSSFDVLIVDILNGETFPDLGKTGNFIAAIKRLVTSGGYIIFNRIFTEDHQEDVHLFIEYVETFLGETESEIVAGYTNSDNILIFGKV
jgi:spermidine synthase